jgi:hypothetical protein
MINEGPILTIEIAQKKLQRYYDICGGQYHTLIERFAIVQDSKLTFESEYKRLNRQMYRASNVHLRSGEFTDVADNHSKRQLDRENENMKDHSEDDPNEDQ